MHFQRIWFNLSLDYTIQGCSEFFVTRTFEVVLAAVSNSDLSDTTRSLTLLVVFGGYFVTLTHLKQLYNYSRYSEEFKLFIAVWGIAIAFYLVIPFMLDTRSLWVSIIVAVAIVLLRLCRQFEDLFPSKGYDDRWQVIRKIMTQFLQPLKIHDFFKASLKP
jgi:hypothetical protein